jgi:methyltransferase (TIGR00027 family)
LEVPPELEVIWYEIDRPDSIRLKSRLIKEQGVQPPVSAFRQIGLNFNDTDVSLSSALEEHDFDPQIPTIFVMEGFLPYLTKTEIEDLAEELNMLVPGNARLIMTCLNESLLDEFQAPNRNTVDRYPGTKEILPLFHTCWEEDTKEAFESMGWTSTFTKSREEYATQYLNVELLPYDFPCKSTSTELIIVMRRPQSHDIVNFIRKMLVGTGC